MNHLNQTYNSIKYRYNGLPNKIQIIIIALSVSLIYILPLLTISNGVLNGDDLHFHIDRCWVYLAYGKVRLILGLFTKLGRE
ncbi:putative satC [Streptococcus mutans]|nr:putative satC [Streptococcus mutans]